MPARGPRRAMCGRGSGVAASTVNVRTQEAIQVSWSCAGGARAWQPPSAETAARGCRLPWPTAYAHGCCTGPRNTGPRNTGPRSTGPRSTGPRGCSGPGNLRRTVAQKRSGLFKSRSLSFAQKETMTRKQGYDPEGYGPEAGRLSLPLQTRTLPPPSLPPSSLLIPYRPPPAPSPTHTHTLSRGTSGDQ